MVLMLVLFLSLGFTTSLAIAWAATVWFIDLTSMQNGYNPAWKGEHLTITIPTSVGRSEAGTLEWRNQTEKPFPYWSRFHTPPQESSQRASEIAAGWPLYCLTLSRMNTRRFSSRDSFYQHYEGAIYGKLNLHRFNADWLDVQYLPRRPITLYLLLDAIFWGVVWLFLYKLTRSWRILLWHRRMRKRRCGWCGYDLQHLKSEQCPECGNVYSKPPAMLAMGSLRVPMGLLLLLVLGEALFVWSFVAQRQGEPIHRAAILGNLEQLNAEIERGANINALMSGMPYDGYTPIMLAIFGNHGEIVDHLLVLGADLEAVARNEGNALTLALRYRRMDVVSKLLDADAAVNAKTGGLSEPLIIAMQTGRGGLELFRHLIEAGADVTIRGNRSWSALDWLVRSNTSKIKKGEMVRLVLEAGGILNPPTELGIRTPLCVAVTHRDKLGIARILLEAGAKIDYASLESAAWKREPKALELLLEFGADMNMRGSEGENLFFRHLPGPDNELIWQRLLDLSVDMDAIDGMGRSALISAVECNDWTRAIFLLEHGADPTITVGGLTAADMVRNEHWKEIVQAAIQKWISEHEDQKP